ncbi:MAG: hypothetical protein ABII74_07385 [Elusimicrobiota bacterium]
MKKMKIKLILIILIVFFAGAKFSFSAEPAVQALELRGDFVEYRKNENVVYGKGNIRITQGETVLTGDEFVYRLDKKIISLKGPMLMKQGAAEIEGRDGEYDAVSRLGKILQAKIKYPPWYLTVDKIEEIRPNEFLLTNVNITSCDLAEPHYSAHNPWAKMVIGEKMSSFNNIVYVGDFPIFYWPFFYRSLKPRHYSIEIKPGYGRREGVYLKTVYGYPLTKNTYAKLYLDYFNRLGWGEGLEYNYNLPGRINGSFFSYYIKETEEIQTSDTLVRKKSERWNTRFYHTQNFTDNLNGILNFNYFSDDTFNDLYNRSDWQWRNKELRSSLSLAYNRPSCISRLTVDRVDIWDENKLKFVTQTLYAPQFSFLTQPVKKKYLPFYYSTSFLANNTFQPGEKYYQQTMQGRLDLSNSFRLNRRITLMPTLGFSEDWSNKKNRLDRRDTYESRYFTRFNWRTRMTRWLDLDVAHYFKQKLEKKWELEDDPYRGVEENRLVLVTNSLWSRRGSLRLYSGYNLRRYKGEVIGRDWQKRLDPLNSVLQLTPYKKVNLYFNHSYDIFSRRALFVQNELSLGEEAKNYLFWGNSYQSTQRGEIQTRFGINFWLTRGWRLQFTSRYNVLYAGLHVDKFEEAERELKIYRDLHCWELAGFVRQRAAAGLLPEAKEFWVTINLKVANRDRPLLYSIQQEQQWYPWRQ